MCIPYTYEMCFFGLDVSADRQFTIEMCKEVMEMYSSSDSYQHIKYPYMWEASEAGQM